LAARFGGPGKPPSVVGLAFGRPDFGRDGAKQSDPPGQGDGANRQEGSDNRGGTESGLYRSTWERT
jgi:hypothetical protein